MKKVPGYISGRYHYKVHVVLKGGKELTWITCVDTQEELNEDGDFYRKLTREWGYSEEVERVYATRYDCVRSPERVREAA